MTDRTTIGIPDYGYTNNEEEVTIDINSKGGRANTEETVVVDTDDSTVIVKDSDE
jgi:hypothetical protein